MSEYKMLGEVVCYCGSCKLNLNHRITLMDGMEPSRVLCLTCNREHGFRRKSPSERKAPAERRTSMTPSQVAKVRESQEEMQWRAKLRNQNKSSVPYSINAEFEIDQLVLHPTFGLGLVIGFEYPDKTQFYFDGGVKILKGRQKKVEKSSTGAF